MRIETANINYEDIDLLREVVKWYGHSHRNSTRSCELDIGPKHSHEIKVIDESDLIPFGIHDIGTQIGYFEMKASFRIALNGGFKKYDKVIYKSDIYPREEPFSIVSQNGIEQTFLIRNATNYYSDFETLQQYLCEPDLRLIEIKSSLQRISPSTLQTQGQKRLRYSIQNDNLFLFGTDLRYGKNYYEIKLDSVYGIEIPDDDF